MPFSLAQKPVNSTSQDSPHLWAALICGQPNEVLSFMVGKYKTKLPCPNFPTTRGNGQGRTDATLLLPSSGQNVQHEKARQSGPVLNDNAKCVMKDLRCVTHDCIVKKSKVKISR